MTGATRGIGRAIALALAHGRRDGRRHRDHRRRRREDRRYLCARPASRARASRSTSPMPPPIDAALVDDRDDVTARSRSSSTTPASRATTCCVRMKDEEWDAIMATNLKPVFRLVEGGAARHDEGAPRPHHPDRLGGRQQRQPGPGELRGGEGRRWSASPSRSRRKSAAATSRSTASRRASSTPT